MGMAQEFTRSCYALRTILSITYMYRLQTMLRLYKQDMYDSIRTCSLYTPGSDYAQEENRRVTILDLASNSIECSALQAWVETTGGMTEEDGESGWEEWIVAFKDASAIQQVGLLSITSYPTSPPFDGYRPLSQRQEYGRFLSHCLS